MLTSWRVRFAAAGCLVGLPTQPCLAQEVRDSAGVRIVRYAAMARPPALWTVESRPTLLLGADTQRPAEEFSRIVGVVRLADGTIVVANGGSNELRYFTAQGAYLGKAGRTGEGPGEFRQLHLLRRIGDTLVAADARGSAARFSPRRVLLGTIPRPSLPGSNPYLLGMLPTGSGVYMVTLPFDQQAQSGVVAVEAALYRVAPSGGVTPVIDRITVDRLLGSEFGARTLVFSPRRFFPMSSSRLCTGHSATFSIRCDGFNGERPLRIDWDKPPRPVTPAITAEFIKGLSRPVTSEESGRRGPEIKPLFADALPHFVGIRQTPDGELWVQDFSMDHALLGARRGVAPNSPTGWTVFSADGLMLASVQLPARFVPFEFGRDYVLGVLRDEDDVELVAQFRLRRPLSR